MTIGVAGMLTVAAHMRAHNHSAAGCSKACWLVATSCHHDKPIMGALLLLLLLPCVQDPELTAWRGASMFAAGEGLWQCVKTRKQYNEAGAGRRDR